MDLFKLFACLGAAPALGVFATQAVSFVPPASSPLSTSANYVGINNGSLPIEQIVPGRVFDRFIQIWLENTDFSVANSTAEFRSLAERGILLSQYFALTHPSQPNYAATIAGSFFGIADDSVHDIPSNVSTMVDVLEHGGISWAAYMENLPADGFNGASFSSVNYVTPGAADYPFYMRKHNPPILFDSVLKNPSRLARVRNFNDFAVDATAGALPQWLFVTPNMVNDAHDTTIDFAANWLQFWLEPLLEDERFNNERTLILLTFDENESQNQNNNIFGLLLGGAVPSSMKGTVDTTYYTHYSAMSTVQSNWGLGCLGRGDTDPVMSNVYELVASATGFENNPVSGKKIPLTNASGATPGPLNPSPSLRTPWPAANSSAICAGGGPVIATPL
ncbi:phosphoesterase family-domain-containing protein [Vararia minispora EC-137]|uniref:Phosphoesterase family-domain-containing protein n=1 Tax=Vararia minispora EC-137 TaxID=1314806 RepID=A0ACB8QD71_9AGAM|nr:phosphoesterase family-domain-containing protein [Vararia minispora EC-137]